MRDLVDNVRTRLERSNYVVVYIPVLDMVV
jgi:hypothetical protein